MNKVETTPASAAEGLTGLHVTTTSSTNNSVPPSRIFVKANTPPPYKKRLQVNAKVPGAPFPDHISQHVRVLHVDKAGADNYPSHPFSDHARAHPAIARLIHNQTLPFERNSYPDQELWSTRWRPKRATEVLGNEHHALYIRSWLEALAVHIQNDSIISGPVTQTNETVRSRPKGKSKALNIPERGVKRRRVVRAITKKRGRKKQRLDSEDELDNFLASSDTNASEYLSDFTHGDQSEDEFEFCRQTLTRIRRIDGDREATESAAESEELLLHDATEANSNLRRCDVDFTDNLTNTLLISGPPGCGKTAAVYACAEELGWNVFEVYPGISRRNSSNLDSLVGDVGKNHIIQTVQHHASRSSEDESNTNSAFAALFRKGAKVSSSPIDVAGQQGTEDQPIEIEGESPVVAPRNIPYRVFAKNDLLESSISPATQQSVILLEEVDILFKEDTGFWPAVVELIKECKRPVIMTCNDVHLVPVADLPLQTTLAFKPCPSPEAVSYLQGLCFAEGYHVSRESLHQLYDTTHPTEGFDVPCIPPNPRTERLSFPDLRRAITQLQLMCTSGTDTHISQIPRGVHEVNVHGRSESPVISARTSAYSAEGPEDDKERWRWFARHTEHASFINSYLHRTPLNTPENQGLSFNMCEPSLDDELGHHILFKPSHVSDTSDHLVFYHNDELIAQEATRLSRGTHAAVGKGPLLPSINPAASGSFREHQLFLSRVVYESQMVDALQHIIYLPAPLMPQSSVFLDYIPWVREMVTADDILERLAWDGMEKEKSGRLTRNSMRAKHARAIELSTEQRGLLDSTKLEGIMPAPTMTATNPNDNTLPAISQGESSNTNAILGSQKESSSISKHSPPISLPPLEYLQQQRRGSITDPSLHAASTDGPRPAANYVFGDSSGSVHNSESSSKQMRKILRSPSTEREDGNAKGAPSSQPSSAKSERPSSSGQMNIESSPRNRIHQPEDVDYNSRRQSIANSSDSQMTHGTKRKMSSDREAMIGEDVDPQLVGPGIPSMDPEGRAQKRRGSAVETHRIAQLSLYDQRRNSVDSRAVGGPGLGGSPIGNGVHGGQWWLNERRDSLTSPFPNGSGGFPPAFPVGSPHGRPPAPPTPGSMATFAWNAAQPPEGQQDPNIQNQHRPFDPQHPIHLAMMPPMAFPPDRRMSVDNGAAGPTRHMRSRSRPPSRQLREPNPSTTNSAGPSVTPEEPSSAPSPSSSSAKPPKDPGATPYSRSPELRVSHKLAERKRRKEMKDLFDELRDHLPADRGMKASKWEILSKAIDFVSNLKQSHQDMAREIEMLRHELDNMRQGIPPFGPGGPPHPQPLSRPPSSQNTFPPGSGPTTQQPPPPLNGAALNGNGSAPATRSEAPS
ncbi:hypothetical protein BJ138DRAFT_1170698 [Hygrophoropsis aurantiaca]|uniref:Uncharacterized protein n=1 Tax=Hygrophoropsis aurantiaca TaxID=72124 RepID=A0ACB8ALW1_9AGAM|nr:hypothetical protein BJ138DRAFT_1170698 [Hygrophoropsis aurantiaca]